MQIDQCRVLRRSRGRLIQTLAVKRKGGLRGREPACRLKELGLADSAYLRDELRRVVAHGGLERGKPLRVRCYIGGRGQILPDHDVQHAIEQRDVGTGKDRQMKIGALGGFRAARIDDDDLE